MPGKTISLAKIWPIASDQLTATQLRSLSDADFQQLKRLVAQRAVQNGSTRAFGQRLARQLELKRRQDRRSPYSRDVLLAAFKPGEILDALVANRRERWRPIFRRKTGQRVKCENFSFLDNPIPTYQTLIEMAVADCESYHYNIDFNDEYVTDIGPYLIFGVMREQMAPLTAGGAVSGPTTKVIEAVGLRPFLKMGPFAGVTSDDVWPLPLMQRRRGGSSSSTHLASEPSTVEIRADEISRKVDLWLQQLDPPSELTEHGTGRIKSIVAETLNNAERHGRVGGDGEWIVAGFMARRPLSGDDAAPLAHICHLSFLNLGRPISETILEAPEAITQQIRRYQQTHSRSRLSPETLATVFALQDGISRVRQGNGNPSGGTGLMDMVEFANEVGRSTSEGHGPKVAILSGRTYIRFDAPYSQGFGNSESGRRLQWFNPANDVLERPDSDYVMDLPRAFPGTLITMRFVLDSSLQMESTDGNFGEG